MSLRGAINAFCRSCLYDPGSGGGNWRQQIEACTSPKCPLFAVRPRSSGKTKAEPSEASQAQKPGESGPLQH